MAHSSRDPGDHHGFRIRAGPGEDDRLGTCSQAARPVKLVYRRDNQWFRWSKVGAIALHPRWVGVRSGLHEDWTKEEYKTFSALTTLIAEFQQARTENIKQIMHSAIRPDSGIIGTCRWLERCDLESVAPTTGPLEAPGAKRTQGFELQASSSNFLSICFALFRLPLRVDYDFNDYAFLNSLGSEYTASVWFHQAICSVLTSVTVYCSPRLRLDYGYLLVKPNTWCNSPRRLT